MLLQVMQIILDDDYACRVANPLCDVVILQQFHSWINTTRVMRQVGAFVHFWWPVFRNNGQN